MRAHQPRPPVPATDTRHPPCTARLAWGLLWMLVHLGAFPVVAAGACEGLPGSVAAGTVPFSTIARGVSSGIIDPIQVVIRNRDEWVAFWGRHTRIRVPTPAPPPVDFSREMVVGIFLGEQSTGGYTIEITKVERVESELRVHYRSRSPDPGAMRSQALTQPHHLIKLSRVGGPVVFVAGGAS